MNLDQQIVRQLSREYQIHRGSEGILYHYTNLYALFAIISTISFWGTRSEFLNYTSELKYIKHVVENVINRMFPLRL